MSSEPLTPELRRALAWINDAPSGRSVVKGTKYWNIIADAAKPRGTRAALVSMVPLSRDAAIVTITLEGRGALLGRPA